MKQVLKARKAEIKVNDWYILTDTMYFIEGNTKTTGRCYLCTFPMKFVLIQKVYVACEKN